MNNAAFRSLVSESAKSPEDGQKQTSSRRAAALGSRSRSTFVMTPRNVPSHDANQNSFRQTAEDKKSAVSQDFEGPPLKKFKASAAPKGSKLGAGYVDRAQLRKGEAEDETNDKATRLKNLEEQLKLGQIDQAQFERLQDQIGVGGDVGSTHLVKGLDWKLLQRVKRGEDINSSVGQDSKGQSLPESEDVNVDEELERALEKDVVARERTSEDQQLEEIPAEQQVLTRDEILRRFREQRNAPAPVAAPALNDRFKKVASSNKPGKKKFVESVNGRRREVLLITKKDGTTKRKTRWIDVEDATRPEQQPLGMEVPEEMAAKQKAMLKLQEGEDDDDDGDDIFKDAGNDYNPLGDIESDDNDNDDEQVESEGKTKYRADAPITTTDKVVKHERRNYFSTGKDEPVENNDDKNFMANDPTILAALKRAAQIRKREEESGDAEEGEECTDQVDAGAKSSAFLAKLKQQERQDAADLDYGFGESRFGDDDDDDGEGGPYPDDGEADGEKKKSGRKRGRKKRKGDKDSMQDVMGVLEGRNKNKKE